MFTEMDGMQLKFINTFILFLTLKVKLLIFINSFSSQTPPLIMLSI